MGIIFGKLFKSVEEDVVPEDVVPEDVVPEDVVSETVKRKAREDGKNPRDKRRRMDNELPSTSGDPDRTNTPEAALSLRSTKRKAVSDDGPVQAKKRTLDLSAGFTAKYEQQQKLGQGGYGFVFAGYRKADNLPVAIKHIPRNEDLLIHEDDNGTQIPMEVAVMLSLAAQSERHPAPINLLDWYNLGQEVILVMERPMPSMDLMKYVYFTKGCMKEEEVKILIRQLVDAAIHLEQKQIVHRDIKLENILIEPSTKAQRVRLIDFGAACFVEKGTIFKVFMGTRIPPEWFSQKSYQAGPITVFQIGAVLFDMLLRIKLAFNFSEDCEDFTDACLDDDPAQRPTLKQLKNHPWLR